MYSYKSLLNNRYTYVILFECCAHQMYNLLDDDICVKFGKKKNLWGCVKLSLTENVSLMCWLIEISEWYSLYGMFSEKLSICRNESAEHFKMKRFIIYLKKILQLSEQLWGSLNLPCNKDG